MPLQAAAPIEWSNMGPDAPALDIVEWSLRRFDPRRLALTTGFGMEGCVLIHMYASFNIPLQVIYLDTGFFFPETHQLLERLRRRYPHLDFVNRGIDLTPQEQSRIYGPRLWDRDPDQCCRLRKVEPMAAALEGIDVWVTGLRRRQSASRAALETVGWNWKYQVIKVNPLAGWRRRDVREFVRSREVPYNVLHDRGFPSIGCTHCTRQVTGTGQDDYSRAGRWSGREKTECGLHS